MEKFWGLWVFWFFFFFAFILISSGKMSRINKENTSSLVNNSAGQLLDKEFSSGEAWHNEIGTKSSLSEVLVD